MSIGVVIGTYGSDEWRDKGLWADLSTWGLADDTVHVHGETLASARNLGAALIETDWIVFLDADDRLDPQYFDAMRAAMEPGRHLYQPATLGVYPDGTEDEEAVLIPKRDIFTGNYLVIGTMCSKDMFLEVGGFAELPILEDWDLWLRMICAKGAKVKQVPDAIYRVGVNDGSRNSNQRLHGKVYNDIRRKYAGYRHCTVQD